MTISLPFKQMNASDRKTPLLLTQTLISITGLCSRPYGVCDYINASTAKSLHENGSSITMTTNLPPMRILLVDHVQDVATPERQSQFPARYEVIVVGVVVVVRLDVDFAIRNSVRSIRRDEEEGEGAVHIRQQLANLGDRLAPHVHAVDLQDLVVFVK